jgi:hypothetical protein
MAHVHVGRSVDCLQGLLRDVLAPGWSLIALQQSRIMGAVLTIGLAKACKAVRAPIFATHAMVHEEEPVGIVFRLDGPQS